MKYEIIKVDRDYRTVSGVEVKDFASDSDAKAHCAEESWTGYSYYYKRVPSAQPGDAASAAPTDCLVTSSLHPSRPKSNQSED